MFKQRVKVFWQSGSTCQGVRTLPVVFPFVCLKEPVLFLNSASAKSLRASQNSVCDFTFPFCSDHTARTLVHLSLLLVASGHTIIQIIPRTMVTVHNVLGSLTGMNEH